MAGDSLWVQQMLNVCGHSILVNILNGKWPLFRWAMWQVLRQAVSLLFVSEAIGNNCFWLVIEGILRSRGGKRLFQSLFVIRQRYFWPVSYSNNLISWALQLLETIIGCSEVFCSGWYSYHKQCEGLIVKLVWSGILEFLLAQLVCRLFMMRAMDVIFCSSNGSLLWSSLLWSSKDVVEWLRSYFC